MHNWRRPILGFYAQLRRNPIPALTEFLNEFYDRPVAHRRQVQAKRVSELLVHAARNVPYYRDVLSENKIVKGGKVDLTRFRQAPELTRDLLRSEFERLKSEDLASRAWYKNNSGGTTGLPVSFLHDYDFFVIGQATKGIHYAWAGRSSGEPMVTLWGSSRDLRLGTQGWRNKLGNFMRNRTSLNSFNMKISDMQHYVRRIRRGRPLIIEAYAESIYELAHYMNASNIRISGVKNVITSAGTLYPFIRDEIERAFGCPTLNRYGSREVGAVAGERVAGAGLEAFNYTQLVEVVNDQGEPCAPGEEGDVLVTCLTNFAMPLIRYRIGDRAVVGTAVSEPIPSVERLETVTGRAIDVFIREDGSTVPGIFFIALLVVIQEASKFKKIQFIQEDYNVISIKLVTTTRPPGGTLEEIRSSLQRVIGPTCRVDFEFVDSIPTHSSGKYRYFVSKVQRPSYSA